MTQLTHIQQIMSRKEKCEAAFVETEKGELGNFLQALLFSLWTQVTGCHFQLNDPSLTEIEV